MIILGIVGKTGAGKSTIARYIQEKSKDVLVIDVDKVAKEIYHLDKEVLQEVKDCFSDCVSESGELDFSALGNRVFSDSLALSRLNARMFPKIKKKVEKILTENPSRNIVIDAAILHDCGLAEHCDYVLHVHAPPERRLSFLRQKELERKKEELVKRIEGQRMQEELPKADLSVCNDGSKEALLKKIDPIIAWINQDGP